MARSGAGLAGWLRRSPVARAVLARLGAGYVRLVHATTRWEVVGQGNLDALTGRPAGFIAALWHGRLFISPLLAPPGRRTYAMISHNRDGDIIAGIVACFGVDAVRGSSFDMRKGRAKGGVGAYRGAREVLAEPDSVMAVTPDGPRGPEMRAQAGVAHLSAAAHVAVLPVAFATRWGREMKSWDRFLVPLPFGRGVKVYGPPLEAPEPEDEAGIERHRAAIEAALIAVTAEADRRAGRVPVAPA